MVEGGAHAPGKTERGGGEVAGLAHRARVDVDAGRTGILRAFLVGNENDRHGSLFDVFELVGGGNLADVFLSRLFERVRRGIPAPGAVGAQNVYWEEAGAFTGEVSVPMIRECGCDYCIVGHSERRGLFGETNEDVNKKVRALLGGRLAPIVCVGESLAVRDEGTTNEYVCAQVKAAFAGVDADDAAKCVVAYEPIWAIGTGRTATPEQAEEVCAAIRAQLAVLFGEETAQAMRILYGGSMNEGNAALLLAEPDIDGGLIGGAALKADSFIQIVKEAC